MNTKRNNILKSNRPDRILSYFKSEWLPLLIVTVTGTIYNIGMTASPWFEGQLAQTLYEIIGGKKQLSDMIALSVSYVLVILFVQAMRYSKRFYVRRFSNNVNRNMKHILYSNLIHKSKSELDSENIGTIMTKAIADVDTCAEGMRKFTTEVFDTGVVMAAYLVMLFTYDWRLTLISCIFPPFAYLIAEKLKKTVSHRAAEYKKSAGQLNSETLDRISGAMTYRTLGVENIRNASYELQLADYEKKAVKAGILETAMQPLYQIISMASVIFIIWFGSKNITGTGWTVWNIASFTTFLSCFAKLALKSSKAAKLFNAVQKAKVSWARIKPLMRSVPEDIKVSPALPSELTVTSLSFAYPNGDQVLSDISFSAKPGEIVGVTGPVACGKSTLGKAFLCEFPYSGNIKFGNTELIEMPDYSLYGTVCYMGHDPELLSDTVEENILLGDSGDAVQYLRAVCMDEEVLHMTDGIHTKIGSGGVRLSGGQQARIALARTLFHKKPVLILDDPFSALDRATEKKIMDNLKEYTKDCVVILISHRLYLFPEFEHVLWMTEGKALESTHEKLMAASDEYREMYLRQIGGADNEVRK